MKFWLLDIDYRAEDKTVLRLFGKLDGKNAVLFDESFEPYIYVLAPKLAEAKKKLLETSAKDEGGEIKPTRAETVELEANGVNQKILKVFFSSPRDVPRYRDAVKDLGYESREDDIAFVKRYMIDRRLELFRIYEVSGEKIQTDLEVEAALKVKKMKATDKFVELGDLKIMSLDIEVYNPEGMPRQDQDPITMVSMANNSGWKKVYTWKKINKPYIETFKDEKEMLQKAAEKIREMGPDILVTYNGDNFDFPYIKARADRLNVKFAIGRDGRGYTASGRGRIEAAKLCGRVHLDVFHIVFNIMRGILSLPRYTLEAVTEKVLGIKKEKFEDDMAQTWDNGGKKLEEFAEYSKEDAEVTVKLAEQFLPLQFEFSRMIRNSLFDVSRMTSGQLVEWMLINRASEKGVVVPSRPHLDERQRRADYGAFKGAFVLEPKKGLHESLAVFDFRSLYPTIIISHNIDPSTIDCDCCRQKTKAEDLTHHFCRKHTGLIPGALKDLLERRMEIKKRMKQAKKGTQEYARLDAEQYAHKLFLNSSYGYMGYQGARWYSRQCAESATALGRHYIKKIMKEAENFGFEVIYGDSITKDRFVTITDKHGLVRIKNIGELFEENKGKCRKVGAKERVFLNGYSALTLNPTTLEPEWRKIKEIIRHKTNKGIFRVNQKHGESVVTGDHSLMVKRGKRLVEAKAAEIGGRPLGRVAKAPPVKQVKGIDLYELLKGYRHRKLYKGREKISEVHADGKWVWYGWMNERAPVRLKRFIKVESAEFEALCRLLGAYIAEGSSSTIETTRSRFGASIAGNKEWLQELKKSYYTLFRSTKASIIKSTKKMRTLRYPTPRGAKTVTYRDGTHKLQMMSSLAAILFRELCGQKSRNKKLPDFIFHVPRKYQEILLNKIVEGDGSRNFWDKRYTEEYSAKNYQLSTTSLALASGLSFLLTQLSQKYTIRFRKEKGEYKVTTCSKHNSRLDTRISKERYSGFVYDLSVEGSHMFVDSCGQVLLHNTDSCFVKGEHVREKASGFLKKVNKSLPGAMELELDGFYVRGVFVTKKRYALINDGGEIKTRGLEVRRRDWSNIAKDTQQQVLRTVLEGYPDKAVEIIRERAKQLKGGKVPQEDLIINTQLIKGLNEYKAIGPHVAAARKAINAGRKIQKGSVIRYIVCKGGGKISDKATPVELYRGNYDPEYYIKNQLLPPVMRILEVFGYKGMDLGDQKKLEDWL